MSGLKIERRRDSGSEAVSKSGVIIRGNGERPLPKPVATIVLVSINRRSRNDRSVF